MSTPQVFEPIGLIAPAQHAPVADLFPALTGYSPPQVAHLGDPILQLTVLSAATTVWIDRLV
jgi:hypothetical protein